MEIEYVCVFDLKYVWSGLSEGQLSNIGLNRSSAHLWGFPLKVLRWHAGKLFSPLLDYIIYYINISYIPSPSTTLACW